MTDGRRGPIHEISHIPKLIEPRHIAAGTGRATEGKKKVGRPPLAGTRSARICVYITEHTAQRFTRAFLMEQYKLLEEGKKMDKSLFLEEIMKQWLKERGY